MAWRHAIMYAGAAVGVGVIVVAFLVVVSSIVTSEDAVAGGICPADHCEVVPVNQNTCPGTFPNYVVDRCGNSDACCTTASPPSCGGTCLALSDCDYPDINQCPGAPEENDEWYVVEKTGADECWHLLPEECPGCCPDEWECGAGCTASNCQYVDLGIAGCGSDNECEEDCTGENLHRKNCLCSGSLCEIVDQHIGCGDSF